MNNKEFKPLQDIYDRINYFLDNETYTLNEKEFKINDGSITIVNKEGKKVFETNQKGNIKVNCNDLSKEDKEVLDLLNDTLKDEESYDNDYNNINVSVNINNSAIAAYVEGINSVLNNINKDIDYELLQDAIKDDIVKYIDIDIE